MTLRPCPCVITAIVVTAALSGCSQWQGANSLPLPGTAGGGPGSYTVQAEMPDVENIERNSRVRFGDVTVGTVSKIEQRGWDAVITMTLDGGVHLPANATAKVGQTSLLGSKHIELGPPVGIAPEGALHDGSVIPLSSAGAYPSTEQTLAALSMVLNGGGIGHIQEITGELATAFAGREDDLRSLIDQFDTFSSTINDQTDDIIAAGDRLNYLAGQVANQKPVLDRALATIPNALTVLKDQRGTLVTAVEALGRFSALAADSTRQTKDSLVAILKQIGPVLESLANAGPALTRSLSLLSTFPFPKETLGNWFRGDYANLVGVVDLTLSRLDSSFLTGTRFEGALTRLEMQWGRTIGQLPSPYTAANPLVAPYQQNQGR